MEHTEHLIIGKKTEERFSKHFLNPISSTKQQDMYEHWDVEISRFGVNYKVDVKGLKKINRSDETTNENFHWIEIRGVRDSGWLYGDGLADLFAFETIDYWVMVEKESLKNLIKEKVKKEYVQFPYEAIYKLYSRIGRKDIITIVKTIDLMSISNWVINKNSTQLIS